MKITSDIIEAIKNGSEKQFEGFEAKVYLNGNFALKEYKNTYAGLINNTSYLASICGDDSELYNILNEYKQSVNNLVSLGVNTPSIIDYYVARKKLEYIPYILMERVKGSQVYIESESTKKVLTKDISNTNNGSEKLDGYYKIMLEKLSDANQWLFDKFAEDCITIEHSKRIAVDVFGENIYFENNKGFSFLDLQILPIRKTAIDPLNVQGKTCAGMFNYILKIKEDLTSNNDLKNKYCDVDNLVRSVVVKSCKALNRAGIKDEDIFNSYNNANKIFNILTK